MEKMWVISLPIRAGYVLPGMAMCRIVVLSVRCFLMIQRECPKFIGKPQPGMALLAMEKTGFAPEETAVMGDRLYTDIACHVNAGISSIFVLSGEGTVEDVEKSDVKPEYIYRNIREVLTDLLK